MAITHFAVMTKCARRFFAHARFVVARIEREFLAVAHGPQPIGRRCRATRDRRAPRPRGARPAPDCTRRSRARRSVLRSSRPSVGYLLQQRRRSRRAPPAPPGSISLLSSSKKTGFSGELRLRSSSDADAIASSRTGSGGTDRRLARPARAAPAARGGGVAAALAGGGGGGVGRATGGCFLPHARDGDDRQQRPAASSAGSVDRIMRAHLIQSFATSPAGSCCRSA